MQLIDGCTQVHVDNVENENGLEQRKIRIMIELLNNLHRIDKTFNVWEIWWDMGAHK